MAPHGPSAWGEPVPAGSTIAPFGFTGELQTGAGLTYLRARWYNAGSGRFVSRDPFAGFSEQPYSLHSYQYGYANPVLYTDPSGESPACANQKICGAEATDWFANEIATHMAYGASVKANVDTMYWRQLTGAACNLRDLAQSLAPFDQIVQELGVGEYKPSFAVIATLAAYEYGLYGLAVNYGKPGNALNYDANGTCGTCNLSNTNPTVTICGSCLDATDLGNIMFGVGGAVRGWSVGMIFGSASLFNGMTTGPLSMLNQDPRGAIVGYYIAKSATLFPGAAAMCLNMASGQAFWEYREAIDETQSCVLCREDMDDRKFPASALYYRSDSNTAGPSETMARLHDMLARLLRNVAEDSAQNAPSFLRPNPVP